MRCAAVLAALLLGACDRSGSLPVQVAPQSFTVTVHWQDSRHDLQAVARSYGEPDPVDGFAVMTSRPGAYRCDLYFLRPADLSERTQGLLGHEFAHCLFGAWHR